MLIEIIIRRRMKCGCDDRGELDAIRQYANSRSPEKYKQSKRVRMRGRGANSSGQTTKDGNAPAWRDASPHIYDVTALHGGCDIKGILDNRMGSDQTGSGLSDSLINNNNNNDRN